MHEFTHACPVVNHQDGPCATRPHFGDLRQRYNLDFVADTRQIDAEAGPLPRLALHLDPATMLSDDSVDGGKA